MCKESSWERITSLREEIKDERVFPSPDKETVEKILYTENVKKDFPAVEAFFNYSLSAKKWEVM